MQIYTLALTALAHATVLEQPNLPVELPCTHRSTLGEIPNTGDQRRIVRALALDMRAHFNRMVGALIIAPSTHAESKVSLEIGDHHQQIKLLGLDELPALAGMLRLGVQLPDPAIQTIVSELFGGRLWHDGARFLFDLAVPRFQLRLLGDSARPEKLLPLIEGKNLLGRRRSSQHYEHRLALAGDELISADHALIICGDDDWATLRDTSKNGTWITPPGGSEERVRGERTIFPGTLLRRSLTGRCWNGLKNEHRRRVESADRSSK